MNILSKSNSITLSIMCIELSILIIVKTYFLKPGGDFEMEGNDIPEKLSE